MGLLGPCYGSSQAAPVESLNYFTVVGPMIVPSIRTATK